MPSENNLNAVFTDIANSIRNKKGTTDTIKPVNMADEIATISSGGGTSVKDFLAIRNADSLFSGFSKLTYEQLSSCLSYDDTSKVTSMYYMFNGCSSLTTIPLLNTSKVTNMQYMFQKCSVLVSVPLIDTSKVTTMYDMFALCDKLEEIPFFDTSNVTNMNGTFRSCYKLKSIPQFNTSKVTTMESMFSQSWAITTIPQLDTSNVTSMKNMFYRTGLTTIPLLDTSKVTDMQYMFYGTNLTTIPQFNTSKVTDMGNMFSNCRNLTTIPQLDTSNVTSMSYMFNGCSSLTTIPSLNTSNVANMSYMFNACSSLTTIPQFNTGKIFRMDYMFNGCYLLEKIDITKLADKTDNNSQFAYSCYSLKTLIIRTMDTIPALNSNAFTNCYHFYGTANETYNPTGAKDGRIYVPDDKVESLKTATNWSVFADIIMPLTIENGEHISKLFIDSSTLSLTISRNATIYLYGFTNTPTVNISVSNENIAQINNLTITTEKITFEVIALGEDGNAIISININGDYSKELSFEVSYAAPIEHRVEQISEATCGFTLNSNEYYESTNKKVPNSYSLCKLVFNAKETNKILKLECINNGENGYDFGILSAIDTTLSLSNNADTTNVYKSFKNQSSTVPVIITYPETTVGEHFIYIKYRKDSSGDTGNDSLQFKVI